ncbi:hypothetical protein, partial [Alistipes finegoldii]|uniref:hypothetical protein n=1 Tax=Alistipes finegoldii TaxID=214856 RepID=UPI003AB7D5D4
VVMRAKMGASPFFFGRPFRIRKRMANVSCLMTLKFGVNKTPARENYYGVKRRKTTHCIYIRERISPNGPFFGSVPFRAPASLPQTAFRFRFGESAEAFAK